MPVLEFNWDEWNANKNEAKHGVSAREAETVFYDRNSSIYQDQKHSVKEIRYIRVGLSIENRLLMIGFTVRNQRIRIITARPASKKERSFYEKSKK